MDYQDEKIVAGNLGKKFTMDRRKELELFDDCLGEALTQKAVPVTIALSAATYMAIKEGFLKNNGLFGMMRKNLLCMVIGVGVSLIGIRENYHDKLAIWYTSHHHQQVRNMILSNWKEENKRKKNTVKLFDKPNHLNLDLERPHFDGIDSPKKDDNRAVHIENITYEELQRRNREKYAVKHNGYY
ncbi:OCIA domain-containing protein 1-like [Contarinia nasturtii]|uniref:OCIA domain-containing protein 1-like n=1 Tax=Contarinia nasturtii TaxID=265458 RepID=UPI0012D37287|nr:OCIA domain-containing protein 1-like [Contarinia nasturtii]